MGRKGKSEVVKREEKREERREMYGTRKEGKRMGGCKARGAEERGEGSQRGERGSDKSCHQK